MQITEMMAMATDRFPSPASGSAGCSVWADPPREATSAGRGHGPDRRAGGRTCGGVRQGQGGPPRRQEDR